MNISYRWLQALRPDLTLSPVETAEVLALRGAPVEEILPASSGLQGLVVGRVEEVHGHPDADRLWVCRVDVGDAGGKKPLQVVCGAPNVRSGGLYPFAPVGSVLPGGLEVGRASIRGVESQGMLCSEAELDLGPDAAGLLELEGEPEPGTTLARALGLDDWLLDVEVTANRGDLLSHLGVARELPPPGEGAGGQGADVSAEPGEEPLPAIPGATSFRPTLETDGEEVSSEGVRIRIQDPDLCSRYLGAVIRGVTVGPSPAWLANRLRAAGARPINNVVDATNYVLLELGQPLHAFDLDRLEESTVVVRRARQGEPLKTLDGEDRSLTSDMLAICDASRPVAIAGVMGGEDSEVSDETTDLLLECALFEPKSVRATRSALGMSTDASYRFERGVDPAGMERALTRAVEIIQATGGGVPEDVVLDVCPGPWQGLQVPLRPSRVETVLGVAMGPGELEELLSPMGFRVLESEGDTLDVSVPGFRSYDVRREVDLIEEVARSYGFDRFPEDLGAFRPGTVPDDSLFRLEDELRDLLVGEGLLEAQVAPFAPDQEGEVALSNPVNVEEGFLRTRLLPGLFRRAEFNFARGIRNIRLFTLGTVFFRGAPGELPREEIRLALILTGDRHPLHWADESPKADLWDVKGFLELLLFGARLGKATIQEGAPKEATGGQIVPGRGFSVTDGDGRLVGWGGEVDEGVVDAPAWADPLFGVELILPDPPPAPPSPLFEEPPAFPGVDRDLALLIPGDLPARKVEQVIREAAGPLLVDLLVFDLYEGKGVPTGMRSVAFRLRYQSRERTLTDRAVDDSVVAVMDRLREELGVKPRE